MSSSPAFLPFLPFLPFPPFLPFVAVPALYRSYVGMNVSGRSSVYAR